MSVRGGICLIERISGVEENRQEKCNQKQIVYALQGILHSLVFIFIFIIVLVFVFVVNVHA